MNAPWFDRNTQLHKEFVIPTLKDFITTQMHAFHAKLPLVASAVHYQIGQRTVRPRLRPRLAQDMLLIYWTIGQTQKIHVTKNKNNSPIVIG